MVQSISPDASGPQPLFDHLSEVAGLAAAARRVCLFLDFDGTLAPIVQYPEAARLPDGAAACLGDLVRRDRFVVAVVSGRSNTDLRQRIGFERLVYAGNHGLEISSPGLSFVEPTAAAQRRALHSLARRIEISLQGMQGVQTEHKGLSASVHYRRAAEADREQTRRIVDTMVTAAGLFHLTHGLEVMEIRPRVDWSKGAAVRWIMENCGGHGSLPIYLGDDTTDEDAFRVLPQGVTVRVGRNARTSARYVLEYQEGVSEFLAWLVETEDQLLLKQARGGIH